MIEAQCIVPLQTKTSQSHDGVANMGIRAKIQTTYATIPADINRDRKWYIVDAQGVTLGRLASIELLMFLMVLDTVSLFSSFTTSTSIPVRLS